jgi:hypothetical protein
VALEKFVLIWGIGKWGIGEWGDHFVRVAGGNSTKTLQPYNPKTPTP